MKFKGQQYPHVIAPTHVPELNAITVTEAGVEVRGWVWLCVRGCQVHARGMHVLILPEHMQST